MQKVGFIGLGLMGNPMAKNLHKAGFALVVFNRTQEKSKEVEDLGASAAKTPSDLSQTSDVIITMVTGPKEVEAVLFGENGVVETAKPGTVVIDMSTIGKHSAVDIATRLKKHGIYFLDAPVTGSTPKAITGELTIFIGGDQSVFEQVKPVLAAMGTNLHYIGPTGSGQAIKLINNLLVAESVCAVAEGMLLADAMEVDRKTVLSVLGDVPATSPFMKMKMKNMVDGDYPTLFSVQNLSKDVSLAESELSKPLPVLQTVSDLYKKGSESTLASSDISAIIQVIEEHR